MVGYSPWRDAIKGVAGLGGKLLMGAADNFTGGLASKLLDATSGSLKRNSGLIGKVAKGIGTSLLSEKTRGRIANIADTALKYVPEGKVKSALSAINDPAQGKTASPKVSHSEPYQAPKQSSKQVSFRSPAPASYERMGTDSRSKSYI